MIRLQKVLADRGVASRRRAEELIAAGHVLVDGKLVTTLGTKVRPDARISVDGVPTRVLRRRYVLLNKPAGIVSTAKDEHGRKTVVDLVAADERLYPVGRLDTDSEGLLLMTNDGEWADRVLHPRYGHEREYDVLVSGELGPAAIETLRRGIRLEEGIARAVRVHVTTRSRRASRLRIVLQTGWKRQIRRMCMAVGLRVERLVRIRIATLALGRLRTGDWRELTAAEVAALAKPVEVPLGVVRASARRSSADRRVRPMTMATRPGVRATAAPPRAPARRGTPSRPRDGVRRGERVSAARTAPARGTRRREGFGDAARTRAKPAPRTERAARTRPRPARRMEAVRP